QNNLSRSFNFQFGRDGYRLQPQPLDDWEKHLKQRYPDFVVPQSGGDVATTVLAMLKDVSWKDPNPENGRQLFIKFTCQKCHSGRQALGPDLQGVAKRFTRDDLFVAIVNPDRDVSNRYVTTTVQTTSGKTYNGLIVYDSVDGLTLRDAQHNTYRIEAGDIAARIKRRASLMPSGLLRGITASEIADLYAYLQQL
ncbi:MAG: c-type cytochrome, partial [Planctomycetaceae bacterium]|nr:c-type cytochrome [Planctomycetaceae bacterium]